MSSTLQTIDTAYIKISTIFVFDWNIFHRTVDVELRVIFGKSIALKYAQSKIINWEI